MRLQTAYLAATAILCAEASAASFTLTRDGAPAATIVIGSAPTKAASFAVRELNEHVRRISGATLPVVGDDASVDGPVVLVGESGATRALGLRSEDFASQELLVRIEPERLILIGRDVPVEGDAGDPQDPSWVEGRFGKALEFDGIDDLVTAVDSSFSDEAGTLEAWVWVPAEPQEKAGTILRLDGRDPWTYHIVQRYQGTRRIQYVTYDGAKGHSLLSGELDEGWHHVAATYSEVAGRAELFIDGESQGSTDYVRTTCRQMALRIGGLPGSGGAVGNALRGRIDEVRVSNVVRPIEELGGPYTADDATVVLLHFDEGRGAPHGRGLLPPMPGWFEDKGTLYAVYELLERFCGVRWYLPGEVGTVYPTSGTLTVTGTEVRRRPAMEYRWMNPTPLYVPTAADRVSGVDTTLWKMRIRLGGAPFAANHSFYGYYERFLTDHPDWFAQGYPGKPPQLCYTNPELIAQVAQDARDYFDGRGAAAGARAMGDFFGLVPMDNSSYCQGERCRAEMDLDRDLPQFSKGTVSNYIWGFVNQVARELRRTHPDKWISALAYSRYAYHPDRVKLEPNIAVMMCLHMRNWWLPCAEKTDRTIFDAWVNNEPGRPLYLWLYYNFPAFNGRHGKYNAFPGYFAHRAVRQMAMYHRAGIKGIFMEHSCEVGHSHLLDLPDVYVTWRLADDASLDGDAMIDEFFRLYYGAAGDAMQRLYEAIETTYSDPASYPEAFRTDPRFFHQNEEIAWKYLGTAERMARFADLLDEARTAAVSDLEKQGVALFEKGVWEYMLAGRRQYLERLKERAKAPPTATAPRLAGSADGDPAKVDWAAAAVVDQWFTASGDPSERRVTARLAHDGAWLYVQLEERLDPGRLVSTDDIWHGDDWEVFIARQRDKPYRQLAINPEGKWTSLAWGEERTVWESGVVVASDISAGDRWTVRLALPLDRLAPGGVRPGETIYGNFCRARGGASELLVWSPLFEGSFHTPGRFGALRLQ